MRSCAIHVHKHSVEAMLLQQCREVTTVILSITLWLPSYMGQSLIRCNIIHAHMAGHTAVMLALHYQFAERGITGDPDLAFAEEHPIFICDKRSYTPLKGTIFRSFVVQLLPDRIALCLRDDFFPSHLLIFTTGRSPWNWTDDKTICP